jgi:hypothetical protein
VAEKLPGFSHSWRLEKMPRTWGTIARSIAAAVCAAFTCVAAPPLTVVQDVLYKADGTKFDGIAQISWKSFQAGDGSEIPQHSINVRVSNGSLRVFLVPTTNAANTVMYTVKFNADGRTQFTEHWAVPPSAAPVRLRDVRSQAPAPGNLTEPDVAVAIGNVSGLRTELDLRPAKGASYVTSRAAVINNAGAIDAALGLPGDCLRVDGTTAPCGSGGLMFIDGETPAGVIDGVNTAFALSGAPTPTGSLTLFRNGMLLRQGIDYSISGKNVTLAAGNLVSAGDRLQAWYRLPPTGTAMINFTDSEVPLGSIDGINQVFTLAGTPMPASSLRVFRNGLLQKAGVDYDLSVNTITFTSVSIPTAGDILQVWYRY